MNFNGYLILPNKAFNTSKSPLQGPKGIRCRSILKNPRNFQFKLSGDKYDMLGGNILGPKNTLCERDKKSAKYHVLWTCDSRGQKAF